MRRRTWRRSAALLAVPVVLALAACADGDDDEGAGGWVGGEPSWVAGPGGDGDAVDAEVATAAATAPAAAASEASSPVEPGRPVDASPLRTGSVDDNADPGGFVDYLARIAGLGIATRPFDATGRIVASVTREDGGPAARAEVTLAPAGGAPAATLRTTADGTARFYPSLHGAPSAGAYDVTAGGQTTGVVAGGAVTLTVDAAPRATPVALDVLFLLDATGSMGDEIDRLKTTIDAVAAQLDAFEARPDVRFGMTLYRDEGDVFVTSTYDFTADVGAFRTALAAVVADGGGDYPEALDEGLADALAVPSWRDPAATVQLVFLVADAPPHVDRQVAVPYTASLAAAVGRGIKVFPVASSESDDQAEAVFRQMAAATGARFVFLAGGADGAATGAHTDIATTDYEELPLDALVVRLVGEELAALAGPTSTPPPTLPPAPPPTNPPGQ
jgi:Mg-chelatase subunit ChlD